MSGRSLALGLGCWSLLCLVGLAEDEKDKPKKLAVSPGITFETDGKVRRVLVEARVCLREGQLEQLMTRKNGKEHEALLAADIDARALHAALLLTGAKPGSPVKFEPKYEPASGTKIRITLEYEVNEKKIQVPAQQWLTVAKTKKEMTLDWVFAGSKLVPNRIDPKQAPYFLANDGDVICVSNFESALLDLPIVSPKDEQDLIFEANSAKIPAKGTKVIVILEPIVEVKK